MIEELREESEEEWDKFVENHSDASFSHSLLYRNVVKSAYSHKPVYLIERCGKEIRGVLPLFLINSIFGKSLISLPFADYGGTLSHSEEAERLLVEYVIELCENRKADLELRNRKEISGLPTSKDNVTMVLELRDLDSIWKGLRSEMRTKIRKAEKHLLPDHGRWYLEDFYKVFSKRMREHGTPVHSIDFFKCLLREFGDMAEIFVVKRKEVVGALFSIIFRDTLYTLSASSDRRYFEYCPNNLLNWEAIKYAIDKECRYFDFMRSEQGSGTFVFKRQWGAEPKQLYYQYWPKGLSLKEKRARYRLFISTWKMLPLSFTKAFGPMLRRYIP